METITVQQAASFLLCSEDKVLQLIREEWILGWKSGKRPWKIDSDSVKNFLFYDSINFDELKKYKKWLRSCQKVAGFSPKTAISTFSNSRGKCEAETVQTEMPNGPTKLISPDEMAVKYRLKFRRYALMLVPDDRTLRDDLVQEMSLAVLEHGQPASRKFFLKRALWRAKDYIEYEKERGMISLEEIHDRPDQLAAQRASFENTMRGLLKRGIPPEWLEELVGYKLEPGEVG
jgi:excisionase family DNA binding protein